ncbi:tyrosine-type recombinase/integrase [Lactococcus termiticola]|uniref:Integrase n=1 Tax=Lactococcus termiticola TaxID=2169526 RepID=A0A2R5HGX5_9LACT|nr:tyrosine-type recombinase/integrase [Lactococcus termiticola]GBG97313.1 integrase [Lactococcus termiticola]
MATKNGLRVYPEKATGKFKYRIVMDYYHDYEARWKQVTCGSNSTTKSALAEAKNKLTLKVEKLLGDYNKKKVNLTVSEALINWWAFRKGSVAEGTYQDDVIYLKKVETLFGRWQVSKVEKDHLKDFLLKLEVAPNSRKNFRSKLNLFFDFCEDEGYISENPMYRVRLPKHKETLEEKQKREDKYFTVEEMARLLETMTTQASQSKRQVDRHNNERKRLFVEFQFSLGDRISESLGLRYQDIDFEQGILKLRAQLDVFNSSAVAPKRRALKTKHSERDILLKNRELEILRWFKGHQPTHSEFIFVQENGCLIQRETMNRYLKRFCEVFPYKLPSSFTTHALRHGNVMLKKELGIDEQVIVRDGGWADTQMISRVYGRHITPKILDRSTSLLQDFSVENSRNIHKKREE